MLPPEKVVNLELAIGLVVANALKVSVDDARALVAEYANTETMLPIANPEEYSLVKDELAMDTRAASAFLIFRKAIEDAGL